MQVSDQVLVRIVSWCERDKCSSNSSSSSSSHTPVVAISGPQGSGKSHLVAELASQLQAQHKLKAAVLSADDFYLPFAEQQALAQQFAGNPLLQYRGLPSTHDVELAAVVIQDLVAGRLPVHIPRYDKAANGGRGDRLPKSQWTVVSELVDVVLFEGWFLGFKPWDHDALQSLYSQQHAPEQYKTVVKYQMHSIVQIMRALQDYNQKWHPLISHFVHLHTEHLEWITDWRWEQEENLRASRGGDGQVGLTRQQVIDFVDRFMPMYELCSQTLFETGFDGVNCKHSIAIVINKLRQAIRIVDRSCGS